MLEPMKPRYTITVRKPQGGFAAELTDHGPIDKATGMRTAPEFPKTLEAESFGDVVALSCWLDKHAALGATRHFPDGPV